MFMDPVTVFLSDTGQIPISSLVLEKLKWKSGMKLTVVLTDNGLLVKPDSPNTHKYRLEDLRGFLKHEGPPISDEALLSPVDYNEPKNLK